MCVVFSAVVVFCKEVATSYSVVVFSLEDVLIVGCPGRVRVFCLLVIVDFFCSAIF